MSIDSIRSRQFHDQRGEGKDGFGQLLPIHLLGAPVSIEQPAGLEPRDHGVRRLSSERGAILRATSW